MNKKARNKIRKVFNSLPEAVKDHSTNRVKSMKKNGYLLIPVNHESRMRRIYNTKGMPGVMGYHNEVMGRYADNANANKKQ